jgi:hypothetical protein
MCRAFAAFFDLRTNRSGDSGAEVAEARGGMEGSEPPASTLQPALLSVEGRTHHVSVHYRETAAADFVRAAVDTALEIHRTQVRLRLRQRLQAVAELSHPTPSAVTRVTQAAVSQDRLGQRTGADGTRARHDASLGVERVWIGRGGAEQPTDAACAFAAMPAPTTRRTRATF